MATQFTCPLCGHGFDPAAHLACQTCPLHAGCHLVCCPACGHTTVDQRQSRLARWVSSFLGRLSAQRDQGVTPQGPAQVRARQYTLVDLPVGQSARVADVSALPMAQREQLQGYGILPGRVLRISQCKPVTVVQIEHTELALETEIARAVWVDELAHSDQ